MVVTSEIVIVVTSQVVMVVTSQVVMAVTSQVVMVVTSQVVMVVTYIRDSYGSDISNLLVGQDPRDNMRELLNNKVIKDTMFPVGVAKRGRV